MYGVFQVLIALWISNENLLYCLLCLAIDGIDRAVYSLRQHVLCTANYDNTYTHSSIRTAVTQGLISPRL